MEICKHDFELIFQCVIDIGRNKMFKYQCKNCKKEKIKFLDSKTKLPMYGLSLRKEWFS